MVSQTLHVIVEENYPIITCMLDTNIEVNNEITLHFSAVDVDGYIKQHYWSFDGINFRPTNDSTIKRTWGINDFGPKTVWVQVMDDDWLISRDSFTVTVTQNAPSITAMNDTSIAVNRELNLSASASDKNGTIPYFLWSEDNLNFDTTIAGSIYKKTWNIEDYGLKSIFVKAIDNDGIPSNTDTILVNVHQYKPVVSAFNDLGKISDTIISQSDSLLVAINANDTNGIITEYLWDLGGDGWDLTTTNPDSAFQNLSYPLGGYVTAIVGAKDDDGVIGTDTFNILFNRAPTSCNLNTSLNSDKGGWSDFNYAVNSGSIQVSFTGVDPDGAHDQLKYDFYWGDSEETLTLRYSGVNSTVSIGGISVLDNYFWKVVARDLYGDCVVQTGSYVAKDYPEVGLFWNKVSDNVVLETQGDYSYIVPHGEKLLAISKGKWISGSLFNHTVYSSLDGVTWNKVSDNVALKTQGEYSYIVPHGEKLLAISKGKWISGSLYNHTVYSSLDGVTWNKVSDNVALETQGKYSYIVPHGEKLLAISKGKWISGSLFNHTVYSSLDGVTWNKVSDNVALETQGEYSYIVPHGEKLLAISKGKWISGSLYNHTVYSSLDGVTWNKVSDNAALETQGKYSYIVPHGEKLLAISKGKWISGSLYNHTLYSSKI